MSKQAFASSKHLLHIFPNKLGIEQFICL